MLFMLRRNGTIRFLFRFISIALPALSLSAFFVTASSAQNPMPRDEPTVTPLAEVLQEAGQQGAFVWRQFVAHRAPIEVEK